MGDIKFSENVSNPAGGDGGEQNEESQALRVTYTEI